MAHEISESWVHRIQAISTFSRAGAMPGLETREVGLSRVSDSTGQFNLHVSSEKLEVGVDVAPVGRKRDREHVRFTDADPTPAMIRHGTAA